MNQTSSPLSLIATLAFLFQDGLLAGGRHAYARRSFRPVGFFPLSGGRYLPDGAGDTRKWRQTGTGGKAYASRCPSMDCNGDRCPSLYHSLSRPSLNLLPPFSQKQEVLILHLVPRVAGLSGFWNFPAHDPATGLPSPLRRHQQPCGA